MAAGVNGEIIVMSKYYKVKVVIIVLLAIVTILANYLLIPIYGLNGAAIGSAIALVIFNLSKYIFLFVKMKIQPFSLATILTLLVGLIILALGFYLPKTDNVFIDMIYRSATVTITYASLVYFLKLSPDINEQVDRLIGRRS